MFKVVLDENDNLTVNIMNRNNEVFYSFSYSGISPFSGIDTLLDEFKWQLSVELNNEIRKRYKRKDNESLRQFKDRIVSEKNKYNLTNEDILRILIDQVDQQEREGAIYRYIKESNDFFTYGKLYTVIEYWGDFGDFVVLDDRNNKIYTLKHFFEEYQPA